ncbi:MAG: ribosome silencing factor [Curvibacter lanceolatus]|uniref:ribosome silencing factor n=1 Tax=Curvibacter lanceolatus TaxID=86182 RepID=UPI00235333B2|nr:ribosome silencing factor [Curvibacter lanceolatus]MBV5292352.1 ribosome silencing factor [Curvibacter lanceolatus]
MTTSTDSTAKKDIQKLQRAIVDGLEDVKAQDIQVFNTEALSPLFERVIVASGTSNRQTKALASSVRDAVREAGFNKPRTEGEENGEWIIVDCGAAVVHVMQPAIRQYYRLEEIWGATPVRLKLGAPKPVAAEGAKAPAKKAAANKTAAKSAKAAEPAATTPAKAAAKAAKALKGTPVAEKAPAKTSTRAPAKSAVKAPAKTAAKTSTAKPAAKSATKPAAKKAPLKVIKVGAPKKPAAKKAAAAPAPRKKPSKA